MKKRGILTLVIIAVLGAGASAYYFTRKPAEIGFTTSPVTRGDVVDSVASTGTLQAVTTVLVGSQVSGNISWLGADFNSIVKKGQVIAKLDPALFQASIEQSKANMNKAMADVINSQANLDRSKVMLVDAQQKFQRAQELSNQRLLAQADLDAAKTAVDSASAQVQSSQAQLSSSRAVVTQAEANLNQAQVNLDHTIITAPVDGIITQRSVDVGQTVAASMQAPTLFIIAADLTKMQVSANIDEADVGRIRPNQHATFRVDAYPTETFEGTVAQIRLNPIVVQNVTTYATILSVNNSDLKLKPGMTANLRIEVNHKTNVLRIPNAAIRFRPSAEVFAALNQPVPPDLTAGRGGRGGRGRNGNGGGGAAGPSTTAPSNAPGGPRPAPSSSPAPSTSGAPSRQAAPGEASAQRSGAASADQGRGGRGQGGGSGRGGFGRNADPAQRLEQFKAMSPDQQQQFIARLKSRGADTSVFEAALAQPAAGGKPAPGGRAAQPGTGAPSTSALFQPKYGTAQPAETIDALFAPLPPVETRGRVWLYADKQLKPMNVRLGITDGTSTELLSGELQESAPVVTGVTGLGPTRQTAAPAAGNPFQGGGGRGGPGGRGF